MRRWGLCGRLAAIVIVAAIMMGVHVPGALALPTLGITALAPDRSDIVFDDARRVLNISSDAQVLRYDIDAAEFLTPWTIPGSYLLGMDLSPDGSTLAVADASDSATSSAVHLIDIAKGEARTVALASRDDEAGTYMVAYGADGRLLVSSCGLRDALDTLVPLRRYDPLTGGIVTVRSVNPFAALAASRDRSVIAWEEVDLIVNPGRVSTYRVSDGHVTTTESGLFSMDVAVDSHGTRILVPTIDGVAVYDGSVSHVATLAPYAAGVAFVPGTSTALLSIVNGQEIRAYDTVSGQILGTRTLDSWFSPGLFGFAIGRLKVSADGSLVFATVGDGVWIAPLNFADQYQDVPGTPLAPGVEAQAWEAYGRVRTVRSIRLEAGTTLHAPLDVSDGLDLSMELFPPTKAAMSDGVPAVASSKHAGAGVDEVIDYVAPVSDTYYIVTTRVAGAGASQLPYLTMSGAQPDPDDDIPGIPLTRHADGSLEASGDVWDVYATRVHRHEALQVTVTPGPALDADVLVFTGAAKHVVFYKPTLAFAGAAGAAESFYHGFSTDTTCYVAIRAASGSGAYALDSLVAPCPPTTQIALSASSGRKGTPATISGRLMDDNGRSVNQAPVLLESSADGILWNRSGQPMTDALGNFTAPLAITRSTMVRASYAGLPGTYLATVSDVATAQFIPSVSWITKPASVLSPKKKYSVKVGVSAPVHTGVACAGTFHWEQYDFGSWAEVVSFTARGRLNTKTHLMEFTGTTALPSAGQWRVTFELASDVVHGGAKSSARTSLVGQPTLSIAVSKTKVGVGHAVTVSGRMKDLASGAGIKGQTLWIESSENGNEWYWVRSVTTGTSGKYHYTAHPKFRQYYHARFYPTPTWLGKTSKVSKKVLTLFTLTGTKPGDFTTKSVWLTKGTRKFTIVLHGKGQTISLHSPDHTYTATSNAGPGHTWMRIPVLGSAWAHFAVHGYGRYKLTVWN